MTQPFLCHHVKKVALALCDGLATNFSGRVRNHIAYEDWQGLINLKVNPGDYTDAESYFRDAASLAFLKKYESLPTQVDKRAAAVAAFYEAEQNCLRTNLRLEPFIHNVHSSADEGVAHHIDGLRKEVLSILGHRPRLPTLEVVDGPKSNGTAIREDGRVVNFKSPTRQSCEASVRKVRIPFAGRFGPGSTYGDKGVYTTLPDKITSRPTLTSSAAWFLLDYGSTLWGKTNAELKRDPIFVRGNRFVTVPKDAFKDRGICVGASINLFYQLGVGQLLKGCLRSVGIDLTTAADKHKQVACAASLTGSYATIDIKQASDSVAKGLVRLLLPSEWYELLVSLREPKTEIDGKWVNLEKFSAMGNGYTFELETILFLAVCSYVMRIHNLDPLPGVNVHVFGDDMIVPTECSKDVIAVLRFLGFETNVDKTFVEGPFRESCGGDYFKGRDVRPYFQKNDVTEPQHYIAMANGLWRMGHPDLRHNFRFDHIRRAWFSVLDALPSRIRRLRGPSDLGDSVIHDESERWETRVRSSRRYIRGYVPHRPLKPVGMRHFFDNVVLATAVYGTSWNTLVKAGPRDYIVPRDTQYSYRERWLVYS